MEQQIAITVKKVPAVLWKKVRIKAISSGKSISEFVSAALESAVNPKGGK